MANLTENNPITEDGDFDLTVTRQSRLFLSAGGTFDGATVVLKYDAGNGSFVAYDDGTLTEPGGIDAACPGTTIRVTVSDAGASTSIKIQF